eukprot:CAMPEP_0204090452 /NCGR_PEP_ID=MMETSP0360-20130528/188906_1 /ASSEMBLY_ACC=CAM_ASM_000342 /TAXON_ID=268821 /ORGANISM="Scrippsiella Hangoei, Strain SHTV-5" /LENGTH=528 /DNA_ID=CAMNT_0051039711 /DNA_START=60 /DNA_END=1647 /DNA_ORIENTATION=+
MANVTVLSLQLSDALAMISVLQANVNDLSMQYTAVSKDLSTQYNESLDTIWMLICGYLVWFMSAGFCFLEMGSVRVKNSQNILAKNLIVPVVAFLCWYVMGYALAFGVTDTPNKFIGGTYFVLYGFGDNLQHLRRWFFQGAFCDTSASIVSGGVAERMTFFGYVVHTVIMTAFIYPVCVYWAWSGSGWLNYSEDGGVKYKSTIGPAYQDWAGSGVIHLVGGVAALCGAIVVGPRNGRFSEDAKQEDFLPHSVPFTVLGTFILWLGWYGFNPGCVAGLHTDMQAYTAANALVNTTLAPCAGGLVAWLLRRYVLAPYIFDVPALCNGVLAGLVAVTAGSGFVKHWEAIIIGALAGVFYCLSVKLRLAPPPDVLAPYIFDVPALCNGVLAGLVAVTAGSGFVKHWEAIIIGALAGVFYCLSVKLLTKLQIDDPIDAVSVHFTNGLWGTIAIGFFGNPKEPFGGNGVFYGGDQLGVQVVACICFIVWSAVWSLLIFIPLRLVGYLRWSDEIQDLGADVAQHSPSKNYAQQEE